MESEPPSHHHKDGPDVVHEEELAQLGRSRSRCRLSFRRPKNSANVPKESKLGLERSKFGFQAGVKRMFSRRSSASGRSHSAAGCKVDSTTWKSTRGTVGNNRRGSWDLLTVSSSSHFSSPSGHSRSTDDSLDSYQETPVHKGYRSAEDELDVSWNEEKEQEQKSRTLPLSPIPSRLNSQTLSCFVNDATTSAVDDDVLLDFNDETHFSIDSDEQLQRIYRFLCSEKSYLDDLRRVFYAYAEPLRKFSSLTSDEMRILFSDLEPLVNLSRNLCVQLRSSIDRWDPKNPRLDNLFTEEFWCLYEVYIFRYQDIQRLLGDKRNSNPEFVGFCSLREIAGDHSIDVLLELPVKRMAFYADQLADIISDLDEDNPDIVVLNQSANFANRIVKLRRSSENEGYMTLIQERFPNDDLHLMDREVHGVGLSRWKSAARVVQNLGSRKQSYSNQAALLLANNNNTSQDGSCGSLPCMDRTYLMQCPVRLTMGLQTHQRYLFLFSDLLIVAKGRSGSNFRLKYRILVSDLWMTTNLDDMTTTTTSTTTSFSTETSFVIGWPTTNAVMTFESSHSKSVWMNRLKEQITIEKSRIVTRSIRIKIVMRDCSYTAIKSLLVAIDDTARNVVQRCLNEFHITEAAAVDYELMVLSVEDESPYPLIGHEHPFSIWMSHLRDYSIPPTDNVSSTEVKIQFVLHDKRKILQKIASADSNKPSWTGRTLKKLFARSQKQESSKLFGRELSELCDPDTSALPQPIMHMLRKLYTDGPTADGVFRKSGNYAKCQAEKQSLDNGELVNFDDIPVFMTAVLLKDFLRSLPNCLLNCPLYPKWMEVVLVPDETQRVATIHKLVQLLPPCNLLLLRHLMCILYRLANHSDQTKMDSHNLAVCVGQSLLWSPGATRTVVKEDVENVNLLIRQMINSMTEIFGADSVDLFNGLPAPGSAPLNRGDLTLDSVSPHSIGQTEDSVLDSLEQDFHHSNVELDSSPVLLTSGVNATASNNNNNMSCCDSGLTVSNPQLNDDEVTAETADKRSLANGQRSLVSTKCKGEASDAPRAMFRSKKRPAPSVPTVPTSSEPSASVESSEFVVSHDERGRTRAFVSHVSDDSVLGSLDERSEEEISDREIEQTRSKNVGEINEPGLLDAGGTAERRGRNVDADVKTKDGYLGLVTSGCDSGSHKIRPPRLSQLHGTAFSAPEDRENESLRCVDAESTTSGQKSVDSGNFNSEVSQSADSNPPSPDGGLNACRCGLIAAPSRDGNAERGRSGEDVGDRVHAVERLTPIHANVGQDWTPPPAVKLQKQGMTASGSDLFPSQIKNLLQHSNSSSAGSPSAKQTDATKPNVNRRKNDILKSVDVRIEAPEDASEDGGTKTEADRRRRSGPENSLPTYEEAILLKAVGKHPHLVNRNKQTTASEKMLEESRRRTMMPPATIKGAAHLVLRETVSLPLGSCAATSADDATEISRSVATFVNSAGDSDGGRTARTRDGVDLKTKRQLCFGDGRDGPPTIVGDGGFGERSKMAEIVAKRRLDVVSVEDSDDAPSTSSSREGSVPQRVVRGRFRRRNRSPRKRFSDPRMNAAETERRAASELERSKSDSCELRWRAARRRRARETDERSKEKENEAGGGRSVVVVGRTSSRRQSERRQKSRSNDDDIDRTSNAPSSGAANSSTRSCGNRESDGDDFRPSSLTVKNRDWHRELAQQYMQPVSFESSSSPNRARASPLFGREVAPSKDSSLFGYADRRKTDSDLRGRHRDRLYEDKSDLEKSRSAYRKEPVRRVSALPMHSVLSKPSLKNDSSSAIGVKYRQPKVDEKMKTLSNRVSKSNTNPRGEEEGRRTSERAAATATDLLSSSSNAPPLLGSKAASFAGSDVKAASFAGSDAKAATFAGSDAKAAYFAGYDSKAASFAGSDAKAASFAGSDDARPSCDVAHDDYVDDAVLLDPLNISWSVTRLREMYGEQKTSTSSGSGGKSHYLQLPPALAKTTSNASRSRSEETGAEETTDKKPNETKKRVS